MSAPRAGLHPPRGARKLGAARRFLERWQTVRTCLHACGLVVMLLVGGAGWAQTSGGEAPAASADPALDAKVHAIAVELRCLVCQNQTIADSNADLAVDLRNQVKSMVQRGDSREQIIDYMTARYGDFVLYRPPVKATTALLWYGPAVLLVLAVVAFVIVLRRRSRLSADRFEPDPEETT